MKAGNESGDQPDKSTDVERYEQLRRRAFDGDVGGWRLGLAILQHRGVSAWLQACRSVPVASAPVRSARPLPAGEGEALVAALASMALACVAGE